MDQRCPKCGSPKLGCSEIPGTGMNRFRLICVDCKMFIGLPGKSVAETYSANMELLLNYNKGIKMEEVGEYVDDTMKIIMGEKERPNVGKATLENIAKKVGPAVQIAYENDTSAGSPFRTLEENDRWLAGGVVPKTFVCDGCRSTQQGALVAGSGENPNNDFYAALPNGWYMQHPSARAFCSKICVDHDRKRE